MRYVLPGIAIIFASATQQAPAAGHSASAAAGEQIYAKNCASCHRKENPRLGDKSAWKPLIARGKDALVDSVIKGTKKMPHHGGKPHLSREDIEAAVSYMIEKSK
jgi:cytochrome c5